MISKRVDPTPSGIRSIPSTATRRWMCWHTASYWSGTPTPRAQRCRDADDPRHHPGERCPARLLRFVHSGRCHRRRRGGEVDLAGRRHRGAEGAGGQRPDHARRAISRAADAGADAVRAGRLRRGPRPAGDPRRRGLDDAGAVRCLDLVPGQRHALRRGRVRRERHRADRVVRRGARQVGRHQQRRPAATRSDWVSTDPVASYLATLALGRYTKIEDVGPGGLPITYWIRTGRDEDFIPALKRSPEMLEWLADRYGPVPVPVRRRGPRRLRVGDGDPADGHIRRGARRGRGRHRRDDRDPARTSTPTSGSATP